MLAWDDTEQVGLARDLRPPRSNMRPRSPALPPPAIISQDVREMDLRETRVSPVDLREVADSRQASRESRKLSVGIKSYGHILNGRDTGLPKPQAKQGADELVALPAPPQQPSDSHLHGLSAQLDASCNDLAAVLRALKEQVLSASQLEELVDKGQDCRQSELQRLSSPALQLNGQSVGSANTRTGYPSKSPQAPLIEAPPFDMPLVYSDLHEVEEFHENAKNDTQEASPNRSISGHSPVRQESSKNHLIRKSSDLQLKVPSELGEISSTSSKFLSKGKSANHIWLSSKSSGDNIGGNDSQRGITFPSSPASARSLKTAGSDSELDAIGVALDDYIDTNARRKRVAGVGCEVTHLHTQLLNGKPKKPRKSTAAVFRSSNTVQTLVEDLEDRQGNSGNDWRNHRSLGRLQRGKKLDPLVADLGGLVAAPGRPLRCRRQMKMAIDVNTDVKAKVREVQYDVCEFYKESGLAQKIARSQFFEQLSLFVIALNAVWLAIETDFNTAEYLTGADPHVQVIEHSFVLFFVAEWLVRFASFDQKQDGLRDVWFVFDGTLVFIMVMDTWLFTLFLAIRNSQEAGPFREAYILKVVRLVRLSRLSRLFKLMRCVPEMMVMLKAMFAATRALTVTLVFLLFVIYVCGLALRMTCKDTESEATISSVQAGMYMLFIFGLFPDWHETIQELSDQAGILQAVLFIATSIFLSMTIMNMLIGVLVEVVKVASLVEQERLDIQYLNSVLADVSIELGCTKGFDGVVRLDEEEFRLVLTDVRIIRALLSLHVDIIAILDYTNLIFGKTGDLDEHGEQTTATLNDVLEVMLNLREGSDPKKRDIIDMRYFLQNEFEGLKKELLYGFQSLKESMAKESTVMLTSSVNT